MSCVLTNPSPSTPGIVIKYENVEYKRAVQVAHLVLDVFGKARRAAHSLLESPEVRLTGTCTYVVALDTHLV